MKLTAQNAAAVSSRFIDSIPAIPTSVSGQGIVICAGGIKYNPCAFVLIRMLRHLGCQLPIEVWYLGSVECDSRWIKLVERFDVRCVDAQQVRRTHPHPRLKGWPLKPYAILHSRFEEVLFLDADNVPVTNPAFLFDCHQFRETGTVFWPDISESTTPRESPLWQMFGVPACEGPDQESGQLLVDKSRCWRAINLCNWYNENSKFYYQHVYGDKDTFRFAWFRLNQPISWVDHPVSRTMPFTLLQHDFEGNPLFQHRFAQKWSLSRNNPRSPGFQHEDQCREFLDELRENWKPEGLLRRGHSRKDDEETRAVQGKTFEFQQVGFNRRQMKLNSDFQITQGRTKPTRFWLMRCGSLLLVTADGKPHASLRKTGDGIWEGRFSNTAL